MRSDAVYRVLESELAGVRQRPDHHAPRVLDAGGGSGVWAVPLATAGCAVTVVDPNPNALATLQRRAADAGVAHRVTAMQGDTDALAAIGLAEGFELVLGHGLLEVVDDVDSAMRALVAAAAPGAVVSVLAANRYAAVLARALAGRLPDAVRLLHDPDGRLAGSAGDPLQRRFDTEQLRRTMEDAGLVVELIQGQGVVSDLVPGSLAGSAGEALVELELAAAVQPPLRDIATRLHALGRVTR